MATIIIPGGNQAYVAHQANTTYVLKAGTTIDTTDQVALNAYAPTSHRTFQINGTLTGSEEGISAGNWP